MQIGLIFPRREIGTDAPAIREFAQTAEGLGYSHVSIEEHVLGVDPQREGWDYSPRGRGKGPVYTNADPYAEPMVLASFLAAVTERLLIDSTVLILPQRPAGLVAKQAAELANLSQGRFRLGIGGGWNPVEFEALGADFHTRGKRQEEQVELMRRLWSEDIVHFEGAFHRFDGAGINPRPRYEIPIWFGGSSDVVLRRIARIGDGWIPGGFQADRGIPGLEQLHTYLKEQGRDPAAFPIEVFYPLRGQSPEGVRSDLALLSGLGVSHLSVTLNTGAPESISGVIARMKAFREQFLP
jgi:probable F420-dependent oxidoreductase